MNFGHKQASALFEAKVSITTRQEIQAIEAHGETVGVTASGSSPEEVIIYFVTEVRSLYGFAVAI